MSISNFCKKHENFISNLTTALVTTLTAICGWIFTSRNVQKQIKNNEYTQMKCPTIVRQKLMIVRHFLYG